jgi:hypothetical protein
VCGDCRPGATLPLRCHTSPLRPAKEGGYPNSRNYPRFESESRKTLVDAQGDTGCQCGAWGWLSQLPQLFVPAAPQVLAAVCGWCRTVCVPGTDSV